MVQVDKDLQETVSHPRLQGRTLRIAGLIGLAIAVLAVATGLAVRWRHEAAVTQWTLTTGCPNSLLRHATARWLSLAADPARRHTGMVRCAHLCSCQRVSKELVF